MDLISQPIPCHARPCAADEDGHHDCSADGLVEDEGVVAGCLGQRFVEEAFPEMGGPELEEGVVFCCVVL